MSYLVSRRVYLPIISMTRPIAGGVEASCTTFGDALRSASALYADSLRILEDAGVVYISDPVWSYLKDVVHHLGRGAVVCYPYDYDIWCGDFIFCIEWYHGGEFNHELVAINVSKQQV